MRPDYVARRLSFRNKLGFTERQESKMIGFQKSFFRKGRPAMPDICVLKHDLAAESVRKSPDKGKIEAPGRKTGQAHDRLSEIESRNFRETASVLDSRQLDTGKRVECLQKHRP